MAFLSDHDKKGQMQLYVAPSTGGKPRKLTNLTGYLTDPRFSPDGTHIALLFAENAPSGGGPLEAEPIETGVIGGEIHNQRLTIVDTTTGAAKQVSPADMNIYEYDWSPDSGSFALTSAPGPGDNNWWIAQLYTMSADTGKMKSIFRPETQIALPRWSPDGQSIAFIQGLMSDEGFTGGDVFTIASSGGQSVNRTPDRKSSVSSIQWITPAKMLLTEIVGGGSAISTLELPSGRTERLWQGGENIHDEGNFANFSAARDGKIAAVIRSDWQHPPEIWAGPIGDWKQLTHANDNLHPQMGRSKKCFLDERRLRRPRLAPLPARLQPFEALSHGSVDPRRPRLFERPALARRPLRYERPLRARLLRFLPQPKRQLRPRRVLHQSQRQRFRLR